MPVWLAIATSNTGSMCCVSCVMLSCCARHKISDSNSEYQSISKTEAAVAHHLQSTLITPHRMLSINNKQRAQASFLCPLTISKAPLITPHRMLQYCSSWNSLGSSTNSVSGLSVKICGCETHYYETKLRLLRVTWHVSKAQKEL